MLTSRDIDIFRADAFQITQVTIKIVYLLATNRILLKIHFLCSIFDAVSQKLEEPLQALTEKLLKPIAKDSDHEMWTEVPR